MDAIDNATDFIPRLCATVSDWEAYMRYQEQTCQKVEVAPVE